MQRNTWRLLKVTYNYLLSSSYLICVCIHVDLRPKKFETFLAAKGFSRLVECCLLLWNNDSKSKKHKKETAKVG